MQDEETKKLIALAQKGDQNAKDLLVKQNFPLIKSVVRWYKNKGIEYDDLYQLGCLGFVKAINNFDISFNVKFSTYCVPMIVGEIKRFMRDDGAIKVSRAIKSLNIKINKFSAEYFGKNSKSPTVAEIAKALSVPEEDVVLAINSSYMPMSLNMPIEDSDGLELVDRIEEESLNYEFFNSLALKDVLEKLPKRDKKIIMLRFYLDCTQSEIAQKLNVSQVQVSRLENKILKELKKQLCTDG